jgi:hypothetical protein
MRNVKSLFTTRTVIAYVAMLTAVTTGCATAPESRRSRLPRTEANSVPHEKTAGSLSPPTAALLEELKQWKISNPAQPSRLFPKSAFEGPADRSYNLKNKKLRKFLQHEKQTFGINLGWTDDASPATATTVARWFFARHGGRSGPLTYCETLALGNGRTPSFIHHQKRDTGINLNWSDAAIFEWKLLGGGCGRPIDPNQYLAVYNERANEFLIFFDRTAGGDIGWPSSQTWGQQLKGELLEQAKKAALEALLAAAG